MFFNYASAPRTVTEAEALLSAIEDKEEENKEPMVCGNDVSFALLFNKDKFLDGMNDGQKAAGEFILRNWDKDSDNDQLLMILHGAPGTGKTFLIERLRDTTNVKMRITATSGIAAMSLKGTTIDSLLGKGLGKNRKPNIQIVG